MMKKILLIYLPILLLLVSVPDDAAAQRKRSSRARTTVTKKRTSAAKKKNTRRGTAKKTTTKRTATKTKQNAFRSSSVETAEIKDLKSEKAKIQKEIAEKESRLRNNQADVNKRLKKLVILNGEIAEREKHIVKMQKDISTLNSNITVLTNDIRVLVRQLKERKSRYMQSLRKMQMMKGGRNDLQFIFSAKSFDEMYRRMRYLKEYSAYQKAKGEKIKQKHQEITKKKNILVDTKSKRENLLQENEKEKKVLVGHKDEQQGIVNSLQAQQKEIKTALDEQRRKSAQLNQKIERLIAAEIEKARKKAEEEARRRAAELAKKAPASTTKKNSDKASKYKDAEVNTPFKYEDPDYKITGDFEHNKGKLPMPITGPYRIISHFGQYNVSGLNNVTLDNKGINIQGQAGAKARAVFDGVISAIFRFEGTMVVMVRHGGYISVYCNLASVNVSRDQKVSAKQVIGTVGADHILQFQLRKGITKLNPEAWVR